MLKISKILVKEILCTKELSFLARLMFLYIILLSVENSVTQKKFFAHISLRKLSKIFNASLHHTVRLEKKIEQLGLIQIKRNWDAHKIPKTNVLIPVIPEWFYQKLALNQDKKEISQKTSFSKFLLSESIGNTVEINLKKVQKIFSFNIQNAYKCVLLMLNLECIEKNDTSLNIKKRPLFQKLRIDKKTLDKALNTLESQKIVKKEKTPEGNFQIYCKKEDLIHK